MTIQGLPEHLKDYSLAYVQYFATGEGVTIQAQILYKKEEPEMRKFLRQFVEKIPCVVEKEYQGQKYLDYNPVFQARFYECFGVAMWYAFVNCCVEHNNVLDLKMEMYYNLS